MLDKTENIQTKAPAFDSGYLDDRLQEELEVAIESIPQSMIKGSDVGMPGLDPEVSFDPYTTLGKLRDEVGDIIPRDATGYGGLQLQNLMGHDLNVPNFLVLGYETMRTIVMDRKTFLNHDSWGDFQRAHAMATVNDMDGEEHTIERRLFAREVFSKDQLTNFSADTIQPMARYLVERMATKLDNGEQVDLCRNLAIPLVYSTMARIIGLPLRDLSHFLTLAGKAFGGMVDVEAAIKAVQDLHAFFQEIYDERVAADDLNGSDLMSLMSHAEYEGHRFSPERVVGYARFLLPAGIETTWRQIANTMLGMLSHPDQYRLVAENPERVDDAVEEGLRWMSSAFTFPRRVAMDTSMAGVDLPEGALLCCMPNIANRDPRVFEDPDRFDIDRKKQLHLAFTMGAHNCLGQHLARQALTAAVQAMTEILPDVSLPPDFDLSEAAGGVVVRAPFSVPIMRSTGT